MRGVFWSMEHRPPPPRDTQLPFDMLFITVFYTCHVKEVVYHRGEQLRLRTSLKLYIVLYRNTMKHIEISLNKILYTYTALIPNIWCFLYSINANFDSNVLVEQMIKILGRNARFIVKCPLSFYAHFEKSVLLENACRYVGIQQTVAKYLLRMLYPTDFTLGTLIIIDLQIIPSSRVIWTLCQRDIVKITNICNIKTEKVPRGIKGEKSRKDTSSWKLVSKIGA